MASIESLVRSAMQVWFLEQPWQHAPSVHVESPDPGAKPALPTLTVWMGDADTSNAVAREVLPGVFLTGYPEARVGIILRAGSAESAEAFREDWRNVILPAAIDASQTGQLVIPLTIRVADKSYTAKLYLTAETRLAGFEETQTRGLHELRCFGVLVFPALSVRAPSALMSISLEIGGQTYEASDFRVPLLQFVEPEQDTALAADDIIALTFDQPMDLASLQLAVDEDDFTVAADPDDERRFTIAPTSGEWPAGAFGVAVCAVARSRGGTPITPFSLSYFSAALEA